MNRIDIINVLLSKISGKKYLEIGVEGGLCFPNIKADYKVGVDPDPRSKATVIETSDKFFEKNTDYFDVIFIDGLHQHEQVERDILNSLNFLSHGGYIVCHDLLPTAEYLQTHERTTGLWTGDCWKAWVKLRSTRSDLVMYTIDTDWGCGVIQKGKQETIDLKDQELSYENFVKNKNYWMNVISLEDFTKKLTFSES